MTKDWLKVNGDETLSHAERSGFSKQQILDFIEGKVNSEQPTSNIPENTNIDADLDDMFA